jgi:glycosyltransferase involved in cell wall biosynthesis
MAGPAIRCLEIGKQLSNEFDVTVLTPHSTDLPIKAEASQSFQLVAGAKKPEIERLVRQARTVIIQANVLKPFPNIAKLAEHLVVDLYDPYLFTINVQYETDPATASSSFRMMHQVLQAHMLQADFSMCASERQRDYWIGRFCALGRIDPAMYHFDPSLRKLIDVVPFGLPARSPARNGVSLRDLVPEIAPDDLLLLWGGGIWDWFDPLTIIKAVGELSGTISNIRLVFMGTKAPNPQVPVMEMTMRAQELARSLGLLDRHVFFLKDWVNYEQRANFLLDADIAVSAHFDLPETRFSFRTRMLDYFWTNRPIITTCGDHLSDLVEENQAGITVPCQDVESWKQAIAKLAGDRAFREACQAGSAKLSNQFSWPKVIEPLRQYCHSPHKLPPYKKVIKPSLLERAKAVYSRGGKELVIKRSSELLKDLLP